MASVGIRDVKKAFGSAPVIHGVDLSIGDGEIRGPGRSIRLENRQATECVTTETEQAGATTGVQD